MKQNHRDFYPEELRQLVRKLYKKIYYCPVCNMEVAKGDNGTWFCFNKKCCMFDKLFTKSELKRYKND